MLLLAEIDQRRINLMAEKCPKCGCAMEWYIQHPLRPIPMMGPIQHHTDGAECWAIRKVQEERDSLERLCRKLCPHHSNCTNTNCLKCNRLSEGTSEWTAEKETRAKQLLAMSEDIDGQSGISELAEKLDDALKEITRLRQEGVTCDIADSDRWVDVCKAAEKAFGYAAYAR